MSKRFTVTRRDRKCEDNLDADLHESGSSATRLEDELAVGALGEGVLNAHAVACCAWGVGCQTRELLAAIRNIKYVQKTIDTPHVCDTRTSMQWRLCRSEERSPRGGQRRVPQKRSRYRRGPQGRRISSRSMQSREPAWASDVRCRERRIRWRNGKTPGQGMNGDDDPGSSSCLQGEGV